MPSQDTTFWGLSENKILLQKFLQEFIENEGNILYGYHLLFSTINDYLCKSCGGNNVEELGMLQRSDIEEAYVRMMLYI